MADLLCAAPRCAIPGRHADGCDQADCRGCLPARAADGILLCPLDLRRLGQNAVKAADLHGELELVLKVTGAGERSAGRPGPGTPPRDVVVEMRATIRHILASWCRLIAEERGIGLPGGWVLQRLPAGFIGPPSRTWKHDDTLSAMGAYVARHAEWLAAHECAGEAADELAALVSRAWGLAYPTGTRRLTVGPCPLCAGVDLGNRWVGERLPAGFIGPPQRRGRLEALMREQDQDKLPSEVYCDMVDEHRWPAARWRELDRLASRKRAAV